MKIKITINSSCENSDTKLIMKNVQEGKKEVLLTITSVSGEEDIYVLFDDLKEAINKIG